MYLQKKRTEINGQSSQRLTRTPHRTLASPAAPGTPRAPRPAHSPLPGRPRFCVTRTSCPVIARDCRRRCPLPAILVSASALKFQKCVKPPEIQPTQKKKKAKTQKPNPRKNRARTLCPTRPNPSVFCPYVFVLSPVGFQSATLRTQCPSHVFLFPTLLKPHQTRTTRSR